MSTCYNRDEINEFLHTSNIFVPLIIILYYERIIRRNRSRFRWTILFNIVSYLSFYILVFCVITINIIWYWFPLKFWQSYEDISDFVVSFTKECGFIFVPPSFPSFNGWSFFWKGICNTLLSFLWHLIFSLEIYRSCFVSVINTDYHWVVTSMFLWFQICYGQFNLKMNISYYVLF